MFKTKPRKRARSQIKMFESIMVLIIFFFLLIFGVVMYVNIDIFNSKNTAIKHTELKAFEIFKRLPNLPEFQATQDGDPIFDSVDYYKLQAFKDELNKEDKEIFSKIFPNTKVVIEQVYPTLSSYVVYDGLEASTNKDKVKKSYYPIAIYNPKSEESNFGYLDITIKS